MTVALQTDPAYRTSDIRRLSKRVISVKNNNYYLALLNAAQEIDVLTCVIPHSEPSPPLLVVFSDRGIFLHQKGLFWVHIY